MSRPGQTYVELCAATVATPSFVAASPAERINTVLSIKAPHDNRFSSQFLERDVRLESVTRHAPTTTTSAVFRFRVSRFYCNASGNLHGGAQATIYDLLTSIALQGVGKLEDGNWINGGVSRTLNVTYLRPAPEGMEVRCEVEVLGAGKSLSFLRGVMTRASDGALLSACEHNKAAVAMKPGWGGKAKI